jgi:hypothetical protein
VRTARPEAAPPTGTRRCAHSVPPAEQLIDIRDAIRQYDGEFADEE